MKCRQSGLTNHQWCLENDISPSAFNNWIYRLRQKGFTIPSNTKRQTISNNNAEFVKVAVNPKYILESQSDIHKGIELYWVAMLVVEVFLNSVFQQFYSWITIVAYLFQLD